MVKYTSKYFMCKAKFKKIMIPENMFKDTNRQKKNKNKKTKKERVSDPRRF